MTQPAPRIALRARLVFPVSAPPIEGGIITLQGQQIVAVGQNASPHPARDLGDVAVLPGLINPHTHLEFSGLSAPLGRPGVPLHEWIETVVERRRADVDQHGAVLSTSQRMSAIQTGVRQCLEGGTTTIGDIATWDTTEEYLSSSAVHCFGFRELIGLTNNRVAEQLEVSRKYLATPLPSSARITRGLSPHAPYTAAPRLVQQVAAWSKQQRLNVAMHLAESSDELRLLATGDGPFRDLLQRFDAWDSAAFPGGRSPADYLKLLSDAHRSLIVHGNFLSPEDWEVLVRHRDRMSVVYCPRTHHYFRHPTYPLNAMLTAGVRVALGTDGRASNPDLHLFKELQFTSRHHPDVEPRMLLRLVTLDAAESLGIAEQTGSIEAGKQADLAVVQLGPSDSDKDPYAALLSDDARVCGVWIGGTERGEGVRE